MLMKNTRSGYDRMLTDNFYRRFGEYGVQKVLVFLLYGLLAILSGCINALLV
jgi:hypothetical protein